MLNNLGLPRSLIRPSNVNLLHAKSGHLCLPEKYQEAHTAARDISNYKFLNNCVLWPKHALTSTSSHVQLLAGVHAANVSNRCHSGVLISRLSQLCPSSYTTIPPDAHGMLITASLHTKSELLGTTAVLYMSPARRVRAAAAVINATISR